MVELIEPATWEDIEEVATDNPDVIFGLFGPPGIGKTSEAFELGEALEAPYVGKIQCHDELSPAEIMGTLMPGVENVWIPGAGDLAYREGGLLILDEIDKLSGPCKTYAYGLTDSGPGGTISYVGRIFEQMEGYRVIATMNDDPNNGSLPDALLDRFDAWFFLKEPSERLYNMLDPKLRKYCRRMYKRARDPLAGPDFTFRNFMALQKLVTTLPLDKALLAVCRNNQTLARSMFEALTIGSRQDDDDEATTEEE